MDNLVSLSIIILELIGVGIVIWTGMVGFIKWLKREKDMKIYLGEGFAMGLQFKLGSEILRTVVVKEWSEIAIVAGIIALRVALTFLIHWEIKQEEHGEKEREEEKNKALQEGQS